MTDPAQVTEPVSWWQGACAHARRRQAREIVGTVFRCFGDRTKTSAQIDTCRTRQLAPPGWQIQRKCAQLNMIRSGAHCVRKGK